MQKQTSLAGRQLLKDSASKIVAQIQHEMFDRTQDARVRAATFEWLSEQVATHGEHTDFGVGSSIVALIA